MTLVTVKSDFRLVFNADHCPGCGLPSSGPTHAIVVVDEPGCVTVWLDRSKCPAEDGALSRFERVVGAASEPSGMRWIDLPDMAILALFPQGQGPMAVVPGGAQRGRDGKVLLVPSPGGFELWGPACL